MDASLKNRRAGEPGERTRKGQEPDAGTVIKSVAIIGAGQMGNGIAHVVSLAGYNVLMSDVKKEAIDNALSVIQKNMARQVSRGLITDAEMQQALKRISHAPNMAAVGQADLIIEAATEDEAVKRKIFSRPSAQPEERRNARQQYFVHLDHPPRIHHRSARAVHRHAFHEPGADDAAGRADPRHRDGG